MSKEPTLKTREVSTPPRGHGGSFRGIEIIEWSADNLLDRMMMEALEQACQKLTPVQIIERLKV